MISSRPAQAASKPRSGIRLIFKAAPLAGVQAQVVDIWPRLRSGEYLVTLAFDQPVVLNGQVMTSTEAFWSELCRLCGSSLSTRGSVSRARAVSRPSLVRQRLDALKALMVQRVVRRVVRYGQADETMRLA